MHAQSHDVTWLRCRASATRMNDGLRGECSVLASGSVSYQHSTPNSVVAAPTGHHPTLAPQSAHGVSRLSNSQTSAVADKLGRLIENASVNLSDQARPETWQAFGEYLPGRKTRLSPNLFAKGISLVRVRVDRRGDRSRARARSVSYARQAGAARIERIETIRNTASGEPVGIRCEYTGRYADRMANVRKSQLSGTPLNRDSATVIARLREDAGSSSVSRE